MRHLMQSGNHKNTEEEKKLQPSMADFTSKCATGKKDARLITGQSADTAHIVALHLGLPDIAPVPRTCIRARSLFNQPVTAKKTQALLQAAAYGDYKKVNDILTANPLLLLEKGTVMDYSGRVHKDRTVYQIAKGACDHNVIAKGEIVVEGMVEMIEEHFKDLPMPESFVTNMMKLIEQAKTAGKLSEDQAKNEIENLTKYPEVYYINKVMRDQHEGQFPPGHEAKEAERVQQDRDADHKLMKVLEATSDADVTMTSDLDDKIHRIIRIGITDEEKLTLNDEEKATAEIRANELRRLVSIVMKAPSDEVFNHAFETFRIFLIVQDGFIKKDDVFDFELLKALYQFRNHLEPKEEQTFGKHYNHQLLADVAQSYDDNYVRFGNHWNSPKNKFCWQKRLGWVERGVPACDAQVIAQGPWAVLENGEKSRRSLEFTYGGGSYYPLAADPNWEIGYSNAAGSLGNWRSAACGGSLGSTVLSKLMSSKNTSAHAYATSIPSATKEKPLRSIVECR